MLCFDFKAAVLFGKLLTVFCWISRMHACIIYFNITIYNVIPCAFMSFVWFIYRIIIPSLILEIKKILRQLQKRCIINCERMMFFCVLHSDCRVFYHYNTHCMCSTVLFFSQHLSQMNRKNSVQTSLSTFTSGILFILLTLWFSLSETSEIIVILLL